MMVAASAMMITAPLLAKQTIPLGAILRVRFKIFLPQEGRRTRRATSSKAWHARAQAVFAERNQCGTLCGTFVRFDAVNWGFVRLRFYEFPVCRQNRNVRNALIYWAFRIALSGDPSRTSRTYKINNLRSGGSQYTPTQSLCFPDNVTHFSGP